MDQFDDFRPIYLIFTKCHKTEHFDENEAKWTQMDPKCYERQRKVGLL